jgi:Tfp pilus assembly protein FimT
MPGAFDRLSDTLREQATPRSLIGLAVLLGILAVLGIGSLADAVERKQQDVRELARSVAVQRSLAAGQEWLSTAAALRERRDAWDARFWRGTTTGIVAAQLQNDIEEVANAAGLDRIRIEVQPLPEELADDGRLQFEVTLTARDRTGQFLNFFQRLADLETIVVPTDFDWTRGNSMVRATLMAPAIVESAQASGSSAS